MVYLIITLSVLARFIPHLHNFSPALFPERVFLIG